MKGGGEIVYGSNGDTYAPGGQGVLRDGDTDVLYYHYCEAPSSKIPIHSNADLIKVNKTVGIDFPVSFFSLGRLVGRDLHGSRTSVDPPSFPFAPLAWTSKGSDLTCLQDALLGFNPLNYVDGWPVAQA